VGEDRTPPWRYEQRHRQLANAARRAVKRAGITSAAELKATPRGELMRLLTPTGYDVVNDALKRGDDAALEALIAGEG
jgi:hypothetical protein